MNKVIGKWSQFVVTRRWVVIALLITFTMIAVAGFGNLYFYNNFISWLSSQDPVISLFIKTTKTFSTNELAMVLIKPDKGVFSREFLEKLKGFTERLSERKEVFLVSSLANVGDIKKIEDGIEVRDLLEEVPESAKEMATFKDYVLSREGYKNNVVSGNGEWAAVSVFVASGFDSDKVVKNLIFPEAEKTFAADAVVYYTGIPSDAYFLNKFAMKDITLLTPLIFIIIAVILYASFRSFKGVVFPSLVVMLSSIWLFGLMGHLRIPLTFITTSIPVILTALGSAYGIHVLNKFNHDLQGPARLHLPQLRQSTSNIFVPVILAGITTFVGFLSFKSARLSLIADFGFYSAVGIAIALVIALSLVPALSSFTVFDKTREIKHSRISFLLGKMADFVIKHRIAVAVFSILLLIGFAAGIPKLRKEINFIEYYPAKSPPRQAHNISEKSFNGAYPVVFYLEADNIKSPEVLRVLRRAESFLLSLENLSLPASIVSLVQELNFQLNDRYALPESGSAVGNLWFFVDGRDELKQLLTDDNRKTIMFSKTSEAATRHNKTICGKLDSFIRGNMRYGLNKFNMKELSAAHRETLLNLEADYLSDEIFWIVKHYLNANRIQTSTTPNSRQRLSSATYESSNQEGAIRREKIREILLRVDKLPPPAPDLRVLRNYIFSQRFDFFINDQQKKKIYERVAKNITGGNYDESGVINVLKELVPKEEYDEEIAGEAAKTILFKLNEALENKKADIIWQELNRLFASSNLEFEKRVKSIIYDLLDDLVVLPSHRTGSIPGEKVPVHFFDQSGFPALLSRLDHFLSLSQIQSLVLAYFLTLLLMVIMKRSLVLGLVSTIPIVFTITIMYGFMGHTGIPLDYTTMMLGGISIGVGIDYAIHFVHGFTDGIDRGLSPGKAVRAVTIERGKAILANATAVMAGFAVLLLSAMLILKNFGATMMASMFLAAISALTVLPAAILIINPKIRRQK